MSAHLPDALQSTQLYEIGGIHNLSEVEQLVIADLESAKVPVYLFVSLAADVLEMEPFLPSQIVPTAC